MTSYLSEVVVVIRLSRQLQLSQKARVLALEQLVEDVEVPLTLGLLDNSGLLQQVVVDVTTNGSTLDTHRDR